MAWKEKVTAKVRVVMEYEMTMYPEAYGVEDDDPGKAATAQVEYYKEDVESMLADFAEDQGHVLTITITPETTS